MLGDERLGVRRHTCWCKACLDCDGRALEEGTATAPTARVVGCPTKMRRVHVELTDAAGARWTRNARYADGESLSRKLEEAIVFACATPANGYVEEFKLFVAAPGPRGRVVPTTSAPAGMYAFPHASRLRRSRKPNLNPPHTLTRNSGPVSNTPRRRPEWCGGSPNPTPPTHSNRGAPA